MKTALALLMLVVALTAIVTLTGCGRKGDPVPPHYARLTA